MEEHFQIIFILLRAFIANACYSTPTGGFQKSPTSMWNCNQESGWATI